MPNLTEMEERNIKYPKCHRKIAPNPILIFIFTHFFMKNVIFIIVMLFSALGLRGQSISHIETTKSWYYIYDQDGKKIKTISTSQGELKGYSSTFYIIKQGTAFYITYDVKGKRLHTWGASSVGEILGVAGDTFTSKQGAWIYTWSKDGKKINTRAAK